ncbi:hypothetical protein FB451DRAFT_154448 [Mycena latifolia]|nr:hypothetical protein FB451DRAFT_154448 [Mycena latifolia]
MCGWRVFLLNGLALLISRVAAGKCRVRPRRVCRHGCLSLSLLAGLGTSPANTEENRVIGLRFFLLVRCCCCMDTRDRVIWGEMVPSQIKEKS